MRHRIATNNLKRTSSHRRAMVRNLVQSLFEHGRIRTTVQKAKAARPLAERLITLGKKGTRHHLLLANSALGSTVAAKAAVRRVFGELAGRFAQREGGYTRILHLPRTIRQAKSDLPRGRQRKRSKFYGTSLGDNAEMVLWELCEAEVRKADRPHRKGPAHKLKPRQARLAAPPADTAPATPAPEGA